MKYYVSRQCYWPNGDLVVEIAEGGADYTNPNMLMDSAEIARHTGEYRNPIEALEAAKRVRELWQAQEPGEEIRIEVGNTQGMTMPFESFPSDDELDTWAKQELESLPKCDQCGGIIEELWKLPDDPDWQFCSAYCAEEADNYANTLAEDDDDLLDDWEDDPDDWEDDLDDLGD